MNDEEINNSLYTNTLFYLFKLVPSLLSVGLIAAAVQEYRNENYPLMTIVMIVFITTIAFADSIARPIRVSGELITYDHLWRASTPTFHSLIILEVMSISSGQENKDEFVLIGIGSLLPTVHISYCDKINNLKSFYDAKASPHN